MMTDIEKKKNLSLDEKIQQQTEKLKQLKAQKQALEAREKKRLSEQQRKDETRKKILLGSYLIKKMSENDDENKKILDELKTYLTEERDKKLFNLN